MSLHPIDGRKRKPGSRVRLVRTNTGYFNSARHFQTGWYKQINFGERLGNIPGQFWTGGKVLGLLILVLIVSGTIGFDYMLGGPITHSIQHNNDPTYPLNKLSAPTADLSEFNLGNGPTYLSAANCPNVNTATCLGMASTGPSGTLSTAAVDHGIGSQGLASQHTAFYEQGRWWMFYVGGSAFLNYTTSVTAAGPWTEHATGIATYSAFIESTSFACDANNTEIVCAIGLHSGNNLWIDAGALHADGTSAWGSWQQFVQTGQVNTPEVVYEHTKQQFYVAFNQANLACGPGGNAQSCDYYKVNTDSTLRVWSATTFAGGYNQLPQGAAPACPGDLVQTGVDAGNGSIYMTQYAFYIANSCNGNVAANRPQPRAGFFGEYLTGTTAGPVEPIPATPGIYTGFQQTDCGTQFSTGPNNSGMPCNFGFQDFLFTTAPNVITGIFQYEIMCPSFSNPCVGSTPSNATYRLTPVFGTRTVSGGWSTPVRSASDYGQFLATMASDQECACGVGASIPGNQSPASFAYDNASSEYISENVCGLQFGNVCDDSFVTIWDKNFNIINPVVSFQQFTASYNYTKTGFNSFGMQPRYYPFSTTIPYFAFQGASPTGTINAVTFSDTGNINNPLFGIAETKSPVDLSPAAAKELEFDYNWVKTAGSFSPYCGGLQCSWAMFLTTNATGWQTTNPLYTPYTDPSVAMIFETRFVSVGGNNNFATDVFTQTKPNELIRTQDAGCHTGASAGSFYLCVTQVLANTAAGKTYADLNLTGAATSAQVGVQNCGTQAAPGGNSCSFVANDLCVALNAPIGCSGSKYGMNAGLPPIAISGQSYYVGFYTGPGQFASMAYCFDNGGASGTGADCNDQIAFIANGCFGSSLEIDSCIPQQPPTPNTNLNTVQPVTDSGGWLGTLWRGITSVGNAVVQITKPVWGPVASAVSNGLGSLYNDLLSALEAAGSFIISGIGALEALLKTALNVVGTAFGFPGSSNCGNAGGACGLGDTIFNLINSIISFFTTGLSQAIGQIVNLFTIFLDFLSVAYTWIGTQMTNVLGVIVFAVNVVGLGVTYLGLFLKIGLFPASLFVFVFVFAFIADDGMDGMVEAYDFLRWVVFDTGIRPVTIAINYAIDILVALIGLLPKPFVNISAKFPRIPLIEIHGTFRFPRFNGQAMKEGNLMSVMGFVFVFAAFVFYEFTTPALPGSLASLPSSVISTSAVARAQTAESFYRIFLPMIGLVVFLLFIPTLFSSIFGVRVVGLPATGTLGPRPSLGVHSGRSGQLFRSGKSKFTAKVETRAKKRLGMIEERERAREMRNANEEARRQLELEAKERREQEAERQRQFTQFAKKEEAMTKEQKQIREELERGSEE